MFSKLFLGTTEIDFYKLGNRFMKIFLIEIIIFISMIVLSISGYRDLNLSVDFTGGTTYQLSTNYTQNDISDVLNNTILKVSRYQTFDNSNTIIFRAVESTQERETELLNYLSNKFSVEKNEIDIKDLIKENDIQKLLKHYEPRE